MKLRRFAPLCAALALLLSGCLLRSADSQSGGVYVYRLRTQHSAGDSRRTRRLSALFPRG